MKDLAAFSSSVVEDLNLNPPATPNSDWVRLPCSFRCANATDQHPLGDESERFDCIHFGAAVEEVPAHFFERLAPGGRLVAPVGPSDQEQTLTAFDRSGDGAFITVSEESKTTFSPLHGSRDEQWMDREANLIQVTKQVSNARLFNPSSDGREICLIFGSV